LKEAIVKISRNRKNRKDFIPTR